MHKSLVKYLEQLTYYFKTLGIEEDRLLSRAMISSAEGWFHIIKDIVHNYRDFCDRLLKKHASRDSIESKKRALRCNRIEWPNISSMAQEIAQFISKLTQIDPDIREQKLFREAADIPPFDMRKMLPV